MTPEVRRAQLDVTPLVLRAIFRVKTWLPEYVRGDSPVALGGRELPSVVGTVLPGSERVLCTGPGEGLILSRTRDASELQSLIGADLGRFGLAAINLTDGLSGFEVAGSDAREWLAKSCGLDLHPRAFPAGHCARTRFAQVPVVVDCLDVHRFGLHWARSYSQYLQDWIGDQAA